jgi:hypothetical protein
MPAHARLALAEDLGELGDVELAVRQDEEQPQPGFFADRPQTGQQLLHGIFLLRAPASPC